MFFDIWNPLSLSNEKFIEHLSFIACNSMIASNKQRQKHNNLATIWRAKLNGAHDYSKYLQFVNS
jgi:hypothetical protein